MCPHGCSSQLKYTGKHELDAVPSYSVVAIGSYGPNRRTLCDELHVSRVQIYALTNYPIKEYVKTLIRILKHSDN